MNLVDLCKVISGIVALLNFAGIIVLFIANKLTLQKLMGNDLHHIDLKLDEIKAEQSSVRKDISELSSSLSYLKGQYDSVYSLVTKAKGRK
jgi:hypothetical protein